MRSKLSLYVNEIKIISILKWDQSCLYTWMRSKSSLYINENKVISIREWDQSHFLVHYDKIIVGQIEYEPYMTPYSYVYAPYNICAVTHSCVKWYSVIWFFSFSYEPYTTPYLFVHMIFFLFIWTLYDTLFVCICALYKNVHWHIHV